MALNFREVGVVYVTPYRYLNNNCTVSSHDRAVDDVGSDDGNKLAPPSGNSLSNDVNIDVITVFRKRTPRHLCT